MINSIVIYNIRSYENIKIMQKIFYFIISISFLLSANEINCDICRGIIDTKYLIDPWGNKFHAYHEKNANYCNTCSRLILSISNSFSHGLKGFLFGPIILLNFNESFTSILFSKTKFKSVD